MSNNALVMHARPQIRNSRMLLGFTGWMDGGDVSVGTVDYVATTLGAALLAEIDPGPFYIYNFPGSMEISALFRPQVRIAEGLIVEYTEPGSRFFASPKDRLVLFAGKEPNFGWKEYASCIFAVADEFDVKEMYFVGSVAGLAPHTREPRIFSSVSLESMRPLWQQHGLIASDYEGPASFVTYLTMLAQRRNLPFASLVAEIPAYIQGKNIKCVEAMTRKLMAMLGIEMDISDLQILRDAFERQLNETVKERPELAEQIRSLEKDFDREVLHQRSDDLKAWLEKQGIRLE